ncbi:MAG: hypothetical protein OXF01_18350 [Gemmatimonadetes bacterium]|nr:hypothetical protein [Gemmatimonadota bacterium]
MTIRSTLVASVPLLAMFAALASPAGAQTIPSPYRFIEGRQEVSLISGYMPADPGIYDLGPRSGPVFGARYAIEAVGPIFFEGLLSYLPTNRAVIDPRRSREDWSIGETDVHLVMLDARFDFSLTGRRTWRRISPHVFLGGGLAIDLATEGESEQELLPEDLFDFGTAFTANAGTGLRVSLTSKLMLRAEASMTLWRINTPGGFQDPAKRPSSDGQENLQQREWVAGTGLTLSLGWRF